MIRTTRKKENHLSILKAVGPLQEIFFEKITEFWVVFFGTLDPLTATEVVQNNLKISETVNVISQLLYIEPNN